MVITALRTLGLRSDQLYLCSLASIALCVAMWLRAKAIDQEQRGNAERRALFVGLWPPMFWVIGRSLEEHE